MLKMKTPAVLSGQELKNISLDLFIYGLTNST